MRLGLVGYPVESSLSPALHRRFAEATGSEVSYEVFAVRPGGLAAAWPSLVAALDGFNVTVPHKEEAARRVDSLADAACAIGAVNTVVCSPAGTRGHNTDASGFLRALGRSPGPVAAIVGAGGAARAVVWALAAAGARELRVFNRDLERAARLVAALAPEAGSAHPLAALADQLAGVDLLVHATSAPQALAAQLPIDRLPAGATVFDIQYRRGPTPLLRRAARLGLITGDGEAMLIEQAREAFALWTGCMPPGVAPADALCEDVGPDDG